MSIREPARHVSQQLTSSIIIKLEGTTVRGTEPPDIPQVPLREKKKNEGVWL